MKKKELRNLAKQIAKAQLVIMNSSDKQEIRKAKETIMKLSDNDAIELEDFLELDDMVMTIISQEQKS